MKKIILMSLVLSMTSLWAIPVLGGAKCQMMSINAKYFEICIKTMNEDISNLRDEINKNNLYLRFDIKNLNERIDVLEKKINKPQKAI